MVDTLAKICGQRWPKMLPPVLAAAYCGMLHIEFKKYPEFQAAKFTFKGKEKYDRDELNEIIFAIKSQAE